VHLSAVNPHVGTILEMSAAKSPSPGARWHLPRGSSAAVPGADATTGASAFAFQGTNAHALLRQGGGSAAITQVVLSTWRHQRVWAAPPAHILAQRAVPLVGPAGKLRRQQQRLSFEASLGVPQLAFMGQHQVLGLGLFPAAGFLEVAAASARLLANAKELPLTAMRGAVFASPMLLQGTHATGPVRVRACPTWPGSEKRDCRTATSPMRQ
jgi:acyl transferase domain-containing protein